MASRPINAYEKALIEVKEKLLVMSGLAGQRLADAIKAFIHQDVELAKSVIAADDEIDLLDDLLEKDSLNLISILQPIDNDLRFLTSAVRISHEIERICDNACNIAEIAIYLKNKAPSTEISAELMQMAQLVRKMLKKSLEFYTNKDLKSALEMDDDDQVVDKLYLNLFEQLTQFMKKEPDYIDYAGGVLLAIRYLERIGDHTVNISEMLVFTETGERHPFKRKTGTNK
jgi:phosphate transport system protein